MTFSEPLNSGWRRHALLQTPDAVPEMQHANHSVRRRYCVLFDLIQDYHLALAGRRTHHSIGSHPDSQFCTCRK
jgi:hypothetical protein